LPGPFRLYLVTDRTLVAGGDLGRAVRRALLAVPPGTVGVQLREKDLAGRALLDLACALREITRAAGAPLLVNDRVDVALLCEADGVHLPADGMPIRDARRLLGPGRLIGVSTHAPAEIASAAAGGADFAVFGPVFATPSKAQYGPPLGTGALAAAVAASPLPVFALGGVEATTARACLAAGAAGIAAIRAGLGAPDPAVAVAELLRSMEDPPDG